MARKSLRTIVSAVIAAAYGLNGASAPQAAGNPNVPADPSLESQHSDMWATINRINADNPTAFLKVRVAQQAGQSELVAAVVQAAASADSPADVAAAVEAALLRVGGLNNRNIIALADLLAALNALGLSDAVITATLNAYSIEVAEAVETGAVTATVAAAVLSENAATTLYG